MMQGLVSVGMALCNFAYLGVALCDLMYLGLRVAMALINSKIS